MLGAYGVEGRYPFLDRQVVQEFLWLDVEIKNAKYKSVIGDYLRKHKYPLELVAKKRGFGASTNLRVWGDEEEHQLQGHQETSENQENTQQKISNPNPPDDFSLHHETACSSCPYLSKLRSRLTAFTLKAQEFQCTGSNHDMNTNKHDLLRVLLVRLRRVNC